jgi:hypothetical protein
MRHELDFDRCLECRCTKGLVASPTGSVVTALFIVYFMYHVFVFVGHIVCSVDPHGPSDLLFFRSTIMSHGGEGMGGRGESDRSFISQKMRARAIIFFIKNWYFFPKKQCAQETHRDFSCVSSCSCHHANHDGLKHFDFFHEK